MTEPEPKQSHPVQSQAASWDTIQLATELHRLVAYGLRPDQVAKRSCPLLMALAGNDTLLATHSVMATITNLAVTDAALARQYRILLFLQPEADELRRKRKTSVQSRRLEVMNEVKYLTHLQADDTRIAFCIPLAAQVLDLMLGAVERTASGDDVERHSGMALYEIDYLGYSVELRAERTTRDYTVIVVFRALADGMGSFPLPFDTTNIVEGLRTAEIRGGHALRTISMGSKLYGAPPRAITYVEHPPLRSGDHHTLFLQWQQVKVDERRTWEVIQLLAMVFTCVMRLSCPLGLISTEAIRSFEMAQPFVPHVSYLWEHSHHIAARGYIINDRYFTALHGWLIDPHKSARGFVWKWPD
jgi:hypothetical protein